ncbi:hypothetical protein C5Z25_08360 [Lactobacillus sp. CBA3605]|uniref:hypothetical protein n=1 Tax=Lactobacillus sp. CBA3605 TaxID=2099788 RepID=UPI000CFBBC95|nr:hypothetical protein [Lactobacillus sp. CBA3605]AVK61789.1 hypothetical protein C5Z25_08360 [Lactobacillus sp. CBA3605]
MPNFLQQLFHHSTVPSTKPLPAVGSKINELNNAEWEVVPEYIAVDPHEQVMPALIAASVVTDQAPNSHLVLKQLSVQNPEAQLVSIITSSCALELGDGTFVIKSIRKRVDRH